MRKLEEILCPDPTAPPKKKIIGVKIVASSSEDQEFLNSPIVRCQFNPKSKLLDSDCKSCENIRTNIDSSDDPKRRAKLSYLNNKNSSTGGLHRKQRRVVGPTRKTNCTACKQHDIKNRYLHNREDLKDCLRCETHEPHNPWYVRMFASIIHYWKIWWVAYEYHMVSLKDMMNDDRVNAAIIEVAQKEIHENPDAGPLKVAIGRLKERSRKITINLRAIQDMKYFKYFSRFAIWFISKILSRIYPKILVRESQLNSLREARASGHRLIYLPIHRSHIDYVLISWILSSSGIRSPLVAAGDNLNIPVFNKMMRSVGGFFIKRQMDQKDVLYRAILHSYMERTILDDNDLEFFIEGGRTRSGKPGLPKGGLLNIAMDTLFSGHVDDMLIIPVNFSYEKLIEGNYIREQLGKPKVNENFFAAARGVWNSCQTKFGNARIDFGQPFSVKDFMNSYRAWNAPSKYLGLSSDGMLGDNETNNNNYSGTKNNNDLNIYREGRICRSNSFSLVGSAANDKTIIEDRRNFINCLAQHVIYDGMKCFSLMSTNVLAFLLLNKYRSGVSIEKLAEEMNSLKLELLERKHDVNLDGDMKQVILHALNILGPTLVSQEIIPTKRFSTDQSEYDDEIILKPNITVPNVIDLAYYSTCVKPIYAMESVIATSILVLLKSHSYSPKIIYNEISAEGEELSMKDSDLVSTCMELCELLEYEFIFHPPCQTLEQAIRINLDYMKKQGLIRFQHRQVLQGNSAALDSNYSPSALIHFNPTQENYERLSFLHGLLQSILDTYAVSSLVLNRLIGHEAKEKELQMDMLSEVRCHMQRKLIDNGESLALDPIRNFIKVLLEWQVLETTSKERHLTIYSLQESFNNESSIDDVIRNVSKFQL